MENNDQNPTQPDPQGENPQCDPSSTDSSCCSTGSGGSKGWKMVILIVVLLLGAAVASRSLLQNTPKPSCCPGESPSASGQCPSESTKSACELANSSAVAEPENQVCPVDTKAAGAPGCPIKTDSDAAGKTCPKQAQ
jgi:hypothetical protein